MVTVSDFKRTRSVHSQFDVFGKILHGGGLIKSPGVFLDSDLIE